MAIKYRNMPVECLLNNYIYADFIAANNPYIFTQSLFLIPHFIITNGFITPTDKISYVKSFFGAMFLLLLHFCRYWHVMHVFKGILVNDPSVIMTTIDFILNSIGIILTYIVTMRQSLNTVVLMLRLQRAMYTMDADNNAILANHKFFSWLSIGGVLFYYIISNTTSIISGEGQLPRTTTAVCAIGRFALIICDLNQVYLIRTVALISNILASWNLKMLEYQKTYLEGNHGLEQNKKTLDNFIHSYADIVKAFNECKTVYQPLVFFKTFTTFFGILSNINMFIQLEKAGLSELLQARNFLSCIWNIKNIVLLIIMSTTCEQFYTHARVAAIICARASAAQEWGLRKTCKNVLRYNRGAGGKLRACGVMAVDAALPLRFLGVVVAYTVVLLQFALL